MKIAIVAPCPVPYMVGGAEKLWWGLAAHFNERTAHQAEIIKLPSAEHDLPSLVRGYEAFAALDLGAFDMVISGKYPAWMVRHPNHVCYMLHRLRGLYDSYPGAAEVPGALAGEPRVAALRSFLQRNAGERAALPEFFGRWNELAATAPPDGLLEFPGPLAREVVHWLDGIALSPGAIVKYAAISATVAARPGYFPPGVEVAVAHPPPHRAMQPGDEQRHFFTVSRLDGPKRVALVVEAMRGVKTDLPLVVAGTGPEEPRIRALAAGDPRIRFVGFRSDEEVARLYRDALAVPFVPHAEDYGLIAVEAMLCGKPVVTTHDSGGPCELVDDGRTGFVCPPTAEALASALQRLADDPGQARAMGRAALERAAAVTWEHVERTLVVPPRRSAAPRKPGPRRKLLVATTFAIHPPRHGGQSRVYHLYRALVPDFETVVVSLCGSHLSPFEGEIAPGLREVRIPMTAEHERRNHAMERELRTPLTDVLMPQYHALTPALQEALEREAADAAVVVACHPYLFPALQRLGRPLWYEAQDFELQLKTALFKDREGGAPLIAAVEEVERATVEASELVLCCSEEDARGIAGTFGAQEGRMVLAPNGTDTHRIPFTSAETRAQLKHRMGIADAPVAYFMGSGHWPNIVAVQRIFEFARAVPEVVFAVIGSVCHAFPPQGLPQNVLLLGEVDDITRNLCLQAFDVAVNPMEHGTGTNLKMLDYFAAGMPVVTTELGARGIDEAARYCLLSEVSGIPDAVRDVLGAGAAAARERCERAREMVMKEFDWDAIARRILPRLIEAADRHPMETSP